MVNLLTTEQLAEKLALHPKVVARWRSRRKGPPWVRIGKTSVRYRPEEVERWLSECSEPVGGESQQVST